MSLTHRRHLYVLNNPYMVFANTIFLCKFVEAMLLCGQIGMEVAVDRFVGSTPAGTVYNAISDIASVLGAATPENISFDNIPNGLKENPSEIKENYH